MENKDLQLRKERIIKFLKEKKDYLQYIFLAAILWLAVHIRIQNLELLKDATTGKYVSVEVDSALFLRYAQYIAEHGKLFAVDAMRNFPTGVNIDFGVFTSYFVAYAYKIFHVFIPSITVEYVDIIYPTIATVLTALFLFLFVRRIFNYKAALLAALFLVTVPNFLFRSISSDHDILGLMFIFMTLYFFVVGWQSKKVRNNIIFGVLAAFASILGYSTAGNMAVFFMVVGLFTLLHILLDNVKKSDLYVYPVWYITTVIVLFLLGNLTIYRLITDYTSFLPATLAFLSLGVYLVLNHKKIKKNKFYESLLQKIPKGLIALILTILLGVIIIMIAYGFTYPITLVKGLISLFSSAFVGNRWASTVAENRRVFISDWFGSFGKILVWLFLIGLVFLVYKLVKNLKDYKKLFGVYTVCIFAFFFSKYSENSVLNGSSTLSRILFYGSIIIIVVYTLYYYLRNYYEHQKKNVKFTLELDWKYTLILIIALINIVGGTTAIRLFFELSPFVVIMSSFALVVILEFFLKQKNKFIKYIGVLLILFLLFSPFSFAKGIVIKDAETSYNQVKYSGPSYNGQWQAAGQWVRENTPKNAVFNHWWDYGYWVQHGFERTTVTDGGNRIGWWNYLTARNVLTAPKDEDALGFLYSHNVSYLLIVNEEIGKYPAYSLIGSDNDLDRYSFITLMGLDSSLSKETRNQTVLVYTGGFSLDEELSFNGKVYPKGTPIAGVVLPLEKIEDENQTLVGHNIQQPRAALIDNGQMVELRMKCAYIDRLLTFPEYDYGGCIRLMPVIEGQNGNKIGSAIFMSRKVADSLFGRLYILNQESEYFKLVYDDSAGIPLALYNNRQIGPTKIWKVEYPDGFTVNKTDYEYYTQREFPDLSVTLF